MRAATTTIELLPGLSIADVHARLAQAVHLRDNGHRMLAFYLHDMDDRRLYQDTALKSTEEWAEVNHGLDRRRTAEYIAVGRQLLELPAIDAAFCRGEIGWSKVLQLVKVATAKHDEEWLEKATDSNVRELALAVRLAKPGSAPRKPGDVKGLPDIRFRVRASLDPTAHAMWDQAKQKLQAELGRPVTDAECMTELAAMLLSTEADGTIPGRKRVDSSLYRIVLAPEGPDASAPLAINTPDGPVPLVDEAALRCDAECVHADCGEAHDPGGTRPSIDRPTPAGLRRRVIARDKGRCRCCGSTRRLMVHHIRYRSKGGKTKPRNLITLCTSCHALVHADLLILVGRVASRVRFEDQHGKPVHKPGRFANADALTLLLPPTPADDEPTREPPNVRRPEPRSREEAFAGIVGQDVLLEMLESVAAGSRARGRAFPHTLFVGPAGTGKTTLARGIAARFGARLVPGFGPSIQDAAALERLVARLAPGDMLFLDEIHAVPRLVLDALLEVMTDRPGITVLAATTEDGDLPRPLRSRFGLREMLGFYEEVDLAALAVRKAKTEDFDLVPEAASELARTSRGTPREALRLLDRTLAG